jgi:hypothetical protein
MTRLLTIASALALAACAPEAPPPAATARPTTATAPVARPAAATPAFNPLDTGVSATPGSGGGGY